MVKSSDAIVIGSGCAGLTASIYCSRAGLKVNVLCGPMVGGQLTLTSDIENFPGFREPVDAKKLISDMKQQAENCGAVMVNDTASAVKRFEGGFVISTSNSGDFVSKAVVVATGSSVKWLGLENESKYMGAGVSSCAVCDGFFFKGKKVAVIGGGNSAVEEAIYLSKIASEVCLVHRRDSLRAENIMQKRLFAIKNIKPLWNRAVKDILGDGTSVNGLLLSSTVGESDLKIAVDGVFVAIGHKPNSELFNGILNMDGAGYIQTVSRSTHTNVDGIFVAGDVKDNIYRQAVTAAASGCQAAIDLSKYLESISV